MTDAIHDREFIFLGTATSVGVPMIGCDCAVCTSTDSRDQRLRASALVRSGERQLLIDTTPDMRQQLLRENVRRLDAVLYTHSHADHLMGFDDLRVFPKYLGHDLPVYCDPPVEADIRRVFDYAFAPEVQHWAPGSLPRVIFERIDRPQAEILGLTVTPIPLYHSPNMPVLGFRFGELAYCTDVCRIPAESWALLEGTEILILDALRFETHPTHFSLPQALEVIERIQPRAAYLTHISHQLDPARARAMLPPHVQLAHDGLRLPFRG